MDRWQKCTHQCLLRDLTSLTLPGFKPYVGRYLGDRAPKMGRKWLRLQQYLSLSLSLEGGIQ